MKAIGDRTRSKLDEALRAQGTLLCYGETAALLKEVPWHEFFQLCRELGIFQILTQEWVATLREELRLLSPTGKILEVMSGNGILAHHLGEDLIIPTDIGTEGADQYGITLGKNVDLLSWKDAVEKYQPKVVLASWIPLGWSFWDDMALGFPEIIGVDIGEEEGGATGGCCERVVLDTEPFSESNKYALARTDFELGMSGYRHTRTALVGLKEKQ